MTTRPKKPEPKPSKVSKPDVKAKPAAKAVKPAAKKPPVPSAKPSKPVASAKKSVPTAKASKPAAAKPARPLPPKPEPRRETLERPIAAESVGGLESPDSTYPSSRPGSEAPVPPTRRGAQRANGLDPDPAVVAQIRELEAQLDRLIDEASRHDLSSLDTDDDEEVDDEEEVETGVAEYIDDASDLEETRHLSSRELEQQIERTQTSARIDDPHLRGLPLEPSRFDPEVTIAAVDVGSAFETTTTVPVVDAPRPPHFPHDSTIPAAPESVFDTARELLSTDFYLRKWGRLAMRGRSEEVDDFGFDPVYDDKYRPYLDFLYTKYFRVETSGIESIPSEGRCVLVANHSGTLPLDGVMLKTAIKREHPAGRAMRWLTEDFISHMPFLGSTMNRLGAVRACQENAERLLADEELVAVFPEGVKGIGKLFGERYRLQRFGRGGFIKLCLRTSTPIVPVAVVGAEETNPMLFRVEQFSKALGLPYLPITPTFPLLGPAGLLPAPTKWRIMFGEPLDLSAHGPEAADDEILVGKLAERVRASIQGMLDRAVSARKSVFFG